MKLHNYFAIWFFFVAAVNAAVFGTLSELQKFPVYQTCEAAAVAGVACPVYDPAKPVKSWVDLNPPPADFEGNIKYLSICLARDRKTPAVQSGKPFLCEFTLPAAEAPRLNIPVKNFTGRIQDVPQRHGEVPVPMRALRADEELYFGFGGLPMLRTVDSTPVSGGETPSVDIARLEQLLQTVLAKLDILLATSGNR